MKGKMTLILIGKWREKLRRKALQNKAPAEIFIKYAQKNKWGDRDSLSGKGSNLEATAELRTLLPNLFRELNAKSVIDVPCGDFFWLQQVDLSGIDYLGGDIVPQLVNENNRRYSGPGVAFQTMDLIEGPIPRADVIFVRDCLVHLSNNHVMQALRTIAKSGSTWLVTTSFPGIEQNDDIVTGEWRPIDLTLAPFYLSKPEQLIAEGQGHVKGQSSNKSLAVFDIAHIQRLLGV
jgi:hypothetical protein